MSRRHRNSPPRPSGRRLLPALERWAVFEIKRAADAMREAAEDALEPHGLRLVTFAALSVAELHGPISPSVLATRVGARRDDEW